MLIAYILGKKDREDFSFVFLNLGKGKTGPQARCDLSGALSLEKLAVSTKPQLQTGETGISVPLGQAR